MMTPNNIAANQGYRTPYTGGAVAGGTVVRPAPEIVSPMAVFGNAGKALYAWLGNVFGWFGNKSSLPRATNYSNTNKAPAALVNRIDYPARPTVRVPVFSQQPALQPLTAFQFGGQQKYDSQRYGPPDSLKVDQPIVSVTPRDFSTPDDVAPRPSVREVELL